MKRHKMSRKASQGYFKRTAGHNHIHPKNQIIAGPMRGGIRL